MKKLLTLFLTIVCAQMLFASELTMQMLRDQERAITLNEFKVIYKKRQHIRAVIQKNIKHSRTRSINLHSNLQQRKRDSLKNKTFNHFYQERNLMENRRNQNIPYQKIPKIPKIPKVGPQ